MSRIGNAIIEIPKEAAVSVDDSRVTMSGSKGTTTFIIPQGISVAVTENGLEVKRQNDERTIRALHGFVRAELANHIKGITAGWTKTLELSGVGYRAATSGESLVLTVGFSHPVTFAPPSGIAFQISEGKIVVSGIDKQKVGQVAASIREIKKPEPYKGKGIKYMGEYIRKKAGKAAKAVGSATGGK